jgi:aspartate carbamoyltransferase catalytic subunit
MHNHHIKTPNIQKSIVNLNHFSEDDILALFNLAKHFQENPSESFKTPSLHGTAALLFFENSTRTRTSFESACYRLGLAPILIDVGSGSSRAKGESEEDTVLNVAALEPKVLIIRSGESSLAQDQIEAKTGIPVISAGWGSKGHPSQALLDLYTFWREKKLFGLKLLIVGDVVHSRVASSHFEILKRLGVHVGVCAPPAYRPSNLSTDVIWIDSLDEGLKWCDAVMALRIQLERHQSGGKSMALEDYRSQFGLNAKNLQQLSQEALIFHPGPVNWGTEMESEVFKDPRCRILQQVNCGLYLRMALLKTVLGLI